MTKDKVRIIEVGPRDGLQNEKAPISVEMRLRFIRALADSGLKEIEAGSFVSPKWVPQLADAAEVFAAIERVPGVTYMALVPNEKGLERAVEARVDKIAVFTAASETFNQKNISATIAESIKRFRPVVAASPVPVRGYISTAFHCPYEGAVAPFKVAEVMAMLLEVGVVEISLGDTIGKASPDEVRALLETVLPRMGRAQVALHFHDTFGRAVENARAGYDMGVRVFDASAGGIGGCPFAPGAPGNVSTQALLREFDGLHSVDAAVVDEADKLIQPYLM